MKNKNSKMTNMLNNPGLHRLVAAKLSQPTQSSLPTLPSLDQPANLIPSESKPAPLQLSPSEEANNMNQDFMRKALIDRLSKNYKV